MNKFNKFWNVIGTRDLGLYLAALLLYKGCQIRQLSTN